MKNRDIALDCVKGISISLVLIGHILQFNIINYQELKIFNIIWALQIPLFMILSGYFVTSRGCDTFLGLINIIKKKAIVYLIPFFSYFYLVKVVIIGICDRNFIEATKMWSTQLESSLWYLFVVFILNVIVCIGIYIESKIVNRFNREIVFICSVGVMLLPWLYIALVVNPTLFGAKFVLYYSVLFILGYYCKKYKTLVMKIVSKKNIADYIFTICLFIFTYIIININLVGINDNVVGALIRISAAITGSYIVIYMCYKLKSRIIRESLSKIGLYTLELYYVHMFYLDFMSQNKMELSTVQGSVLFIFSTVIMISLSVMTINIIKSCKITDFIFFAK